MELKLFTTKFPESRRNFLIKGSLAGLAFATSHLNNTLFKQKRPTTASDVCVSIAGYSSEKKSPVLVDPICSTDRSFTNEPIDGYLSAEAWAYPFVVDNLLAINKLLQEKYELQLLVKDAYRPLQGTLHMVRWAVARENGADRILGKYIATRSNHNKIRALDLTLATFDGQELWMGSVVHELNEYAHYEHNNSAGRKLTDSSMYQNKYDQERAAFNKGYYIHPEHTISELRCILYTALRREGYTAYNKEWWHFANPFLPGSYIYNDPIV